MASHRPADQHRGADEPRHPWWARLLVTGRWFVVVGWIAITAGVYVGSPSSANGGNQALLEAVPRTLPAVQEQLRVIDEFAFPVLARQMVVVHDPDGIAPADQLRIVLQSLEVTLHRSFALHSIAAAVPIFNRFSVPFTDQPPPDTVVVLLFFRPEISMDQRVAVSQEFIDELPDPGPGGVAALTGSIPAQAAQGSLISRYYRWVELITVVAVLLIVAAATRSLAIPLLVLTSAGIALFISIRVFDAASELLGLGDSSFLEPVIVALLIGLLTDYALFFTLNHRAALEEDPDERRAALRMTAFVVPVVLVAGLTVAAGTALFLLAKFRLFHEMGPALAMAVGIGLLVGTTFVPATIAILGRRLHWPTRPGAVDRQPFGRRMRHWLSSHAVRRPVAAILLSVGVAGLLIIASPLRWAGLGVNLIASLPSGAEPKVALDAATASFPRGIAAPVELVVRAPGIASNVAALGALQHELASREGVASVLGPADQPLPFDLGIVRASSGDAVRYLVLLDDAPTTANAVRDLRDLRTDMGELLERAGLRDATFGLAGDTAISLQLIDITLRDMVVVTGAILIVDLMLLILFLRAIVAPLLLLAGSVLVVLTALGATAFVWELWSPGQGLTFYVTLAVIVLLLSFGVDYNILVVGRIWDEAEHRPFRRAIVEGVSRESKPVAVAGVTLAASFSLLAIVPVDAFRQTGMAIAIGVLVDTFFVRTYLVPAALSLVGTKSAWPSRRFEGRRPETAAVRSTDDVTATTS